MSTPAPIQPGTTPFPDAAIALNIILKFAEVLGFTSEDDTAAEVEAKILSLLNLSIGDIAGLQNALNEKMAANADVLSPMVPADVRAKVASGVDRAFIKLLFGLAVASGETQVTGAPLVAKATAGEVGFATTVPLAKATLTEYLAASNANLIVGADVAGYMAKAKSKTAAATITVTLDGKRIADGDATDSDTLYTVANIGQNTTLNFGATIHSGLVGREGVIRGVVSSAGSWTVTLATANGITIDANSVSNPGIGSSVGDALEITYRIISTSVVRIVRYTADPA